MKDLSLFIIKNWFASKMKRGHRNFCNGIGSTTTLNQGKTDVDVSCIAAPPSNSNNLNGSPKTLEEMLQLDLEAAAARRTKLDDYGELNRGISCVNNSDVLRSARNALNRYPRFSLDGRDALYRSSFRNFGSTLKVGRKSVCSLKSGYKLDMERSLQMPATGKGMVWCKTSVVGKLMGLDAVPLPGRSRGHGKKILNAASGRIRNLRRMGRCELEKDRAAMNMIGRERLRRESLGTTSTTMYNYGMMKLPRYVCGEDWQFRRAR